jgi:hypothetical protein
VCGVEFTDTSSPGTPVNWQRKVTEHATHGYQWGSSIEEGWGRECWQTFVFPTKPDTMWLYSSDSSDPWGLYNLALHCECELVIAKVNFPQSFPYAARRAIPGLWVGAPETLTYEYSFDNACSMAPTVAETCSIVSCSPPSPSLCVSLVSLSRTRTRTRLSPLTVRPCAHSPLTHACCVWGQTLYVGSNQGANMPGNERAFLTFMIKGEWGDEYSFAGLNGRGRDYTQARVDASLCMRARRAGADGMVVFAGVQSRRATGDDSLDPAQRAGRACVSATTLESQRAFPKLRVAASSEREAPTYVCFAYAPQ